MLALTAVLSAAAETKTVKMQTGERWWGVMNYYGSQMPFDAATDLTMDVRVENRSNQAASFLVSDRGFPGDSPCQVPYSFHFFGVCPQLVCSRCP